MDRVPFPDLPRQFFEREVLPARFGSFPAALEAKKIAFEELNTAEVYWNEYDFTPIANLTLIAIDVTMDAAPRPGASPTFRGPSLHSTRSSTPADRVRRDPDHQRDLKAAALEVPDLADSKVNNIEVKTLTAVDAVVADHTVSV